MNSAYRLEREGEGRYAVYLQDGLRAGVVMGGNGRWFGESTDGCAMGSWLTLKAAAKTVADDASDPIWDAMRLLWWGARFGGLTSAARESDLRIDRRTLREWRGKTDFLWIITPKGTHTLALDPPLRQDDLFRQIALQDDMLAFLVRSRSTPEGVTRVRRGHLARMLSML